MDSSLSLLEARGTFESLDSRWKAIAVGFLTEKARRTGSRRTTEVYARTVARFLRGIPDPGGATPLDVHRFVNGIGSDGHAPAPSTVGVRLAAVSGFYDFACRMEMLERNPAANLRRPQPRRARPRGLSLDEIARLLAVIPGTPAGRLDRAITITALLTGLRRSELMQIRLVDPMVRDVPLYEVRTKGGVIQRRELPRPALDAIVAAAAALERPIGVRRDRVFPISDATFYDHLRRYGETAGLGPLSPHVLRHTAAKLRRQAGAAIEEVSALLGHRNFATTATYLRQLEHERDDGWAAVALALGLTSSDRRPLTAGRRDGGRMASAPPVALGSKTGRLFEQPPCHMERSAGKCSPSPRRSYRGRRASTRLPMSTGAVVSGHARLSGSFARERFQRRPVRIAGVASNSRRWIHGGTFAVRMTWLTASSSS